MSLADLQRQMRDAVVSGDSAAIGPLLVGGQNASKRLAIHLHHYEASLTAAVVGRFPATGWLVGSHRLEGAARQFVHDHPPTAPCITEYGSKFPGFLATWPETTHLTYVPAFADLDWHLGRLAASVDLSAVGRDRLAAIDPTDLSGQASDLAGIRQVTSNGANVPKPLTLNKILETRRAVVDRDDVPLARRTQQDVVADEARRAGHEHAHYAFSPARCSAYQGMVREMPASSDTIGW